MRALLKTAILMVVVLSLLTGILYPLGFTALARLVFLRQSAGSLIERDGRLLGSRLIGQPFTDPGHFWSRPSATGPQPYNGGLSSGSNWGPLNPDLHAAVMDRVAALRAVDPGAGAPPVDLVTSSGSGLDPHISPAAALYQVSRVARARGLPEDEVRDLVVRHTQGRQLGFLGEPVVNVLELNLALDALPRGSRAAGHAP
jgi:K+-transporting ATPase ATPase C chain